LQLFLYQVIEVCKSL